MLMILSLINSYLMVLVNRFKSLNKMLEKIKEAAKKVNEAKRKSVKENITMSEALKQIFSAEN